MKKVLFIAMMLSAALSISAQNKENELLPLGQVIPKINQTVSVKKYASFNIGGLYSVIYFWSRSEDNLKEDRKEMNRLHKKYGCDSLLFQAICLDTTSDEVLKLSKKLDFATLSNKKSEKINRVASDYGVSNAPAYYIIDTERKVVCATNHVSDLEDVIKNLDLSKAKKWQDIAKEPSFIGGKEVCSKFIYSNIKIPQTLYNFNLRGKAVVKFKIDKEGRVSNVKLVESIVDNPLAGSFTKLSTTKKNLLRSKAQKYYGKEAVRVIELTDGKWNPAETNGRFFSTNMKYTIHFGMR